MCTACNHVFILNNELISTHTHTQHSHSSWSLIVIHHSSCHTEQSTILIQWHKNRHMCYVENFSFSLGGPVLFLADFCRGIDWYLSVQRWGGPWIELEFGWSYRDGLLDQHDDYKSAGWVSSLLRTLIRSLILCRFLLSWSVSVFTIAWLISLVPPMIAMNVTAWFCILYSRFTILLCGLGSRPRW